MKKEPKSPKPEGFFEFIKSHEHADTAALLLRGDTPSAGFSMAEAAMQIEARRKTAAKLRRFLSHREFLFPTLLSAEQASHQAVGRFHASLLPQRAEVLDMTAGLGIDALSFGEGGAAVTAIDIELCKCQALRHNARVLGLHNNIKVVEADSAQWLATHSNDFDVIFIDPARRDGEMRRTYAFADCAPDVVSLLPLILAHCPRLLIKASPLLDEKAIRAEIPQAGRIFAVGVKGECKEMLVEVTKRECQRSNISVELDAEGNELWSFAAEVEGERQQIPYAEEVEPGMYLYEPDATVMKFAPWGELCRRFPGLQKLDVSTHLFVSPELHDDFPGRRLQIAELPDKKKLRTLKGSQLNVAVRNYPLGAPALAAKYGIRDGGDDFLYGATAGKRRLLMLCHRVGEAQKRRPAESTI